MDMYGYDCTICYETDECPIECEDEGLVTCWDSSCAATEAECPEFYCEDGYIEDCADDGDCCPETWIGDGFADCKDQAFGCDLTCYDNEGGDCDGRIVGIGNGLRRGLDLNNSEKIRMSQRLNLSNGGTNNLDSRDLISIQIYRNGEFLDEVESDVYSYDDFEVVNGIEYCYILFNVYDEGDSPYSPEACAEPCSDSPPPSLS
jgi:hypothetical protein